MHGSSIIGCQPAMKEAVLPNRAYILTMADKSGGTVYMSFLRNGKMHVAVKTGRDFFELGKSNTDVGVLRQKFLGELRWFTDMIDTLRVEDTLFKKEENV